MQLLDPTSFDTTTAHGLHVIDFTAAWCGPCRVLAPVLDQLAREYTGRARFAAVDVDASPQLAQRFNVRSMPTCIVLRDGREVGRFIGARPRAFVAGVIDRALGGDVAITAP